mmetsp:Transcript_32218/g.80822  ORF Transcript_32218/g.80822 Transcript_32218/m.80822 type:complete len:419 (+) Transcript_32218:214-1470(+)
MELGSTPTGHQVEADRSGQTVRTALSAGFKTFGARVVSLRNVPEGCWIVTTQLIEPRVDKAQRRKTFEKTSIVHQRDDTSKGWCSSRGTIHRRDASGQNCDVIATTSSHIGVGSSGGVVPRGWDALHRVLNVGFDFSILEEGTRENIRETTTTGNARSGARTRRDLSDGGAASAQSSTRGQVTRGCGLGRELGGTHCGHVRRRGREARIELSIASHTGGRCTYTVVAGRQEDGEAHRARLHELDVTTLHVAHGESVLIVTIRNRVHQRRVLRVQYIHNPSQKRFLSIIQLIAQRPERGGNVRCNTNNVLDVESGLSTGQALIVEANQLDVGPDHIEDLHEAVHVLHRGVLSQELGDALRVVSTQATQRRIDAVAFAQDSRRDELSGEHLFRVLGAIREGDIHADVVHRRTIEHTVDGA